MELIILFVSIIAAYKLGCIHGFSECEYITQKIIYQIIEECEEKKVHKFQEANNVERQGNE